VQQKNKENNKKLGNTILLVLVMHLDVWRSIARKHLGEEGLFPISMKADDLFPPAQITTARNKAKALLYYYYYYYASSSLQPIIGNGTTIVAPLKESLPHCPSGVMLLSGFQNL
jgi:hypothetical protein